MNPAFGGSGTPVLCERRTLREWLARPLEPDDIRGAGAIYR